MKLRTLVTTGLGFGVVLLVAGAVGVIRSGSDAGGESPGQAARAEPAALVTAPGATLEAVIDDLEQRLDANPNDHVASATLGLAYVQQARVIADGDLYALAEAALDASLQTNDTDNYLAYAGHSALSAAKHDFVPAREYALQGLEINPYSAILYGALSDVEIQLGNYRAAFDAVQTMIDLSPDTASLSRASYTWELRGDAEEAKRLMQRALDDAPTPADRSFALLHLGDLAFNEGDPAAALDHYLAALDAQPDSAAAFAGRARAQAALGDTDAAIADYERLVARGLEPFYILQFAELLESLGRTDEAAEQYRIYEEQESEFSAREVLPDATFILFFADHGMPEIALEKAAKAIATAPFLDTHDAYAWALHANGRDEEAWESIQKALALGTESALYHYHAGMILHSLGDDDGAREHLTRALEINPNFNRIASATAATTLEELHD